MLPPFGCPTPEVYHRFDALHPDAKVDEARVRRFIGSGGGGRPFNDLAGAAVKVEPRLGRLLNGLRLGLSVDARVTGSGAGLYALADDQARAQAIAGRVEEAGVPVHVVVTQSRWAGS